jgi:hypothetical protein
VVHIDLLQLAACALRSPSGFGIRGRLLLRKAFGSESTGEKALDLLRDHVATVEACPCTCNEGTNPPRFIGERGD